LELIKLLYRKNW